MILKLLILFIVIWLRYTIFFSYFRDSLRIWIDKFRAALLKNQSLPPKLFHSEGYGRQESLNTTGNSDEKPGLGVYIK